MKTLVGAPIHRAGAYVLDKFLANQKQIQRNQPDCDLVFSTSDIGYMEELRSLIKLWGLRCTVISHNVDKPAYAKSRVWDIASGRESIRRYFLSIREARQLLFLDSDMTFDPSIVSILGYELPADGAVFSGFKYKNGHLGLLGAGVLMLSRESLEKIKFRCYEFKNGHVLTEDNMVEMDLFRRGCSVKKGFYLANDHYVSSSEAKHFYPQKMGYRKLTTNSFLRYCLLRTSVTLNYNLPSQAQLILFDLFSFFNKLQRKTASHES